MKKGEAILVWYVLVLVGCALLVVGLLSFSAYQSWHWHLVLEGEGR